ncbi:GIY-YIG nuclease family protein [Candidatus Bathyarchaeota archaeon]|nr:GIY-YIG nuclease family protein [Candidatus Bathyarchaeota archaeon]
MKGVYVLVISVGTDTRIDVGALGNVDFQRGLYAYVGSAQNSLERRIDRHLRRAKRKLWHIDYLLDSDSVKVVRLFHKNAVKLDECKIAEKISLEGVPINGFGSSDCKCRSHLFQITDYQFLREFMCELALGNDGRVFHD